MLSYGLQHSLAEGLPLEHSWFSISLLLVFGRLSPRFWLRPSVRYSSGMGSGLQRFMMLMITEPLTTSFTENSLLFFPTFMKLYTYYCCAWLRLLPLQPEVPPCSP